MNIYTYYHTETSTNTQNTDDDRYETYVGMFGDVHRLDKNNLLDKLTLKFANVAFGFVGLCFVGIFVYIALHILFFGVVLIVAAFRGDLSCIVCLILAVIICILTDKRVWKRK
ncbi:hypothetical protein FACS1894189_4550 [Planctomycetales bacterium]|nr:hypothetical protein FACS1894189_4550 [Planctomycetales bacterium]